MIVAGPTGYVDPATIKSAPVITFVWVKTFKLRVYGPAVLPLMAVYISLAMEVMGDISKPSLRQVENCAKRCVARSCLKRSFPTTGPWITLRQPHSGRYPGRWLQRLAFCAHDKLPNEHFRTKRKTNEIFVLSKKSDYELLQNGVISITRCANRTAGYFCAGMFAVTA